MINFTDTLLGWHDLFLLVGGAAATLMGLLFVGLSLNLDIIRRKAHDDLREIAAQTGNNFFYPLLFAVIFLIPGQTRLSLGLCLLILGVFAELGTIDHLVRTRRKAKSIGAPALTRRFILPLISLALMILVAIGVLAGEPLSLYGTVVAIVILLVAAVQNAWDLLLTIRT
jgi:UDP-N-acetylmuramyl pentapeptide phosphotransferase/UDP-N-acetylglucosamine-1-phosphate transferase